MMDLYLQGREYDEDDYEAKDALRRLMESEHLQMTADDDLLGRISHCIKHNIGMLQRVSELVEGLKAGGVEKEDAAVHDAAEERTDTRTIDDFFLRINKTRRKEHLKNLQPLKGASYG
jgi:hypothetical protein